MQRRQPDNLPRRASDPQPMASNSKDYVDHPRSVQKLTWRKLAVYASTLVLLAFADPRPLTFAIGAALCAIAWLLRVWAFGHLEKNRLMVTTGPYAHTRNPAYLGSFLALIGVSLAAGNFETTRGQGIWAFGAFLVLAFFTVYLPRKFKKEYPRLKELFGEQLDRHAENVPNFWPRLRGWKSGDDRKFSWARVSANTEWGWSIVLALVLIAIWTAPMWSPFALDGPTEITPGP
jgi:protein-S-isoprenylcysteine O-methyltransferase Ste14